MSKTENLYCRQEVANELLDREPSLVVMCQDCKYWVYNFNGCSRNPCTEPWYATDFCSYGCRMTNAVVEEKPTPIRDYMVHGEREGE